MKILFSFLALWISLSISAAPYIHPSMQEAIKVNEQRLAKGEGMPDYVVIDGVRRYTGFNPTSDIYRGAKYLNIQVPEDWEMKEIDFSKLSYSPVRGQIQGSCWAEGACSAFEFNWNALGTKLVFSVQDIIDCSGFGTARSGGQLSLQYALNGLAYEKDYSYRGVDGRCRSDVARQNALKDAPYLRGANGGFPTGRELNYYLHTYGSAEICGSAAALGGGGRQDTPRRGVTNHCYAHAGMRWGPNYGWLPKWYHGVKNSWGDGTMGPLNPARGNWGANPNGYGWYALESSEGGALLGSVITELEGAHIGQPLFPSGPKEFTVDTANATLEAVIEQGAKFDAEKAKAYLEEAIQ